MIPKMFLHTLAAVVVITGLAGAWQIYAGPDGDGPTISAEWHDNGETRHDD